MKTYKTWEAIKMITENTNLKFKDEYGTVITADLNGFIVMLNKDMTVKTDLFRKHIRCKWTLVKEPVSFMEAIKALRKGKKIQCKIYDDGEELSFCYSSAIAWTPLKDHGDKPITIGEILEGKWYIEEDEE